MATYLEDLDGDDDLKVDLLLREVCDLVDLDPAYVDGLRDAVDNAVAIANDD